MSKKSKTNNSAGCVTVLILFGIILCFASSWKSGIFFILLGIVISAISNVKSNQKSPPPLPRNQNRKKGKTAKWFAKDANISIGDKSIGGFVYVGEYLAPVSSTYSDYSSYVDYDAALIRPSLKVNFNNPDFKGTNMDY